MIDVWDISQCATWEDAKNLLLDWQVPNAQLLQWEKLWRWDRLKELVASGDLTDLDQRLMEFYRRVGDTRDHYECLVPERDRQKGNWCLKDVGRGDRMRSHICSDHLDLRVFQCKGECGQNGW